MGDLHEFPKKKRTKSGAKCPICGKPAVEPHQPFCSARCKTVDLGNWLGGNYSIPSEDEPDEEDVAEITKLFDRENP
jgi:endogenous inhibitor of DNA gyrase (YacG/DUF329 family)